MPFKMYIFYCLCFISKFVNVYSMFYNAALYKPAVQSSFIDTSYAYIAVDGFIGTDAVHGQCQHTENEFYPWWMVDLRGQFVIETIQLTNRGDCCSERLHNFTIDIFTEDPRKLTNFPNIIGNVCYHQTASLKAGTFIWNCSIPIVGRFVRILMLLDSVYPLHVCEVAVLVSRIAQLENYYKSHADTMLSDSPTMSLTARNYKSCLMECQQRRLTNQCTAFNWVTATNMCQLFSVNPYLNITTRLSSAPGTKFCIENNWI